MADENNQPVDEQATEATNNNEAPSVSTPGDTPATDAPAEHIKKSTLGTILGYINPIPFVAKAYAQHKLITIIAGVITLLILIGILVFVLLFRHPAPEKTDEPETLVYNANYYPLPDIKMRIKRNDESTGFLIIGLTLKLPAKEKAEDIKKYEPEIIDTLHTFFSSVHSTDLSSNNEQTFISPVGMERLRNSILHRVNTILSPLKIETVLYRKVIVQ